jgi:hypothetical protein
MNLRRKYVRGLCLFSYSLKKNEFKEKICKAEASYHQSGSDWKKKKPF